MILLLLLVVPALIGLLAAYSSGRVVLVSLIGLLLVPTAFILLSFLTADGTRDCSDCGLYWGRYWEPALSLMFGVLGACFWILGAIAAGGLRKLRA